MRSEGTRERLHHFEVGGRGGSRRHGGALPVAARPSRRSANIKRGISRRSTEPPQEVVRVADPSRRLFRDRVAYCPPCIALLRTSRTAHRTTTWPQGAERTRTAVRGFAGLCLTTRPRRRTGHRSRPPCRLRWLRGCRSRPRDRGDLPALQRDHGVEARHVSVPSVSVQDRLLRRRDGRLQRHVRRPRERALYRDRRSTSTSSACRRCCRVGFRAARSRSPTSAAATARTSRHLRARGTSTRRDRCTPSTSRRHGSPTSPPDSPGSRRSWRPPTPCPRSRTARSTRSSRRWSWSTYPTSTPISRRSGASCVPAAART